MNLFPKSPRFFEIFEELAQIIDQSAAVLTSLRFGAKGNGKRAATKTRDLELAADAICHKLYREADSTFITPIDREDIHLLARNLDNIVDLIENLVSDIVLYNIPGKIPIFDPFTKKISVACAKILQLITLLKHKEKYRNKMRDLMIEIHTLENDGDMLIRDGMKYLFHNHKRVLLIIKWKDIITTMENILDECENTADIVEQIMVKNF